MPEFVKPGPGLPAQGSLLIPAVGGPGLPGIWSSARGALRYLNGALPIYDSLETATEWIGQTWALVYGIGVPNRDLLRKEALEAFEEALSCLSPGGLELHLGFLRAALLYKQEAGYRDLWDVYAALEREDLEVLVGAIERHQEGETPEATLWDYLKEEGPTSEE